MKTETLYYGDCLEWLQKWPESIADLIYLDPPFNSKTDYDVLWGKENGVSAQARAFTDTWAWDHAAEQRVNSISSAIAHPAHRSMSALRIVLGESGMLAYLSYMAERLAVMRGTLKPTGSIYLHCDSTASHYLRVVMDDIFGAKNFQNDIIWRRTTAHSDSKKFGLNFDTILYYSRSQSKVWNSQYRPYTPKYKERFRHEDADGRKWSDDNLTAKGLSGGGYEYEYKGVKSLWRVPLQTMQNLDSEKRLHFTAKGGIRLKRYLDESQGFMVQALWDDIPPINSQSRERLGYPTQKPLDLLKRIIRASSNKGDVVLDPFCGCGTTVVAAQDLERSWVGIDISAHAIDLIAGRRPEISNPRIEGIPMDLHAARSLVHANRLDFEAWAITRVAGLAPNEIKTADQGIDGRGLLFHESDRKAHQSNPRLVLGQVKSGKFSLSHLRDFCRVVDREGAAMGIYITLDAEPTSAAKREMARMGRTRVGAGEYPRVQMWSIRDHFERRAPELPGLRDPYTGAPAQELLFR